MLRLRQLTMTAVLCRNVQQLANPLLMRLPLRGRCFSPVPPHTEPRGHGDFGTSNSTFFPPFFPKPADVRLIPSVCVDFLNALITTSAECLCYNLSTYRNCQFVCSHASWKVLKSLGCFPKISRTWNFLESVFSTPKSYKLKFQVLERSGIYLWFNLTNIICIEHHV